MPIPTLPPTRRHLIATAMAVALSDCHRAPPADTTPSTSPTGARALLLDPANAEFTRPAPPVSRLRFETSKGVFVLELHRDWAPIVSTTSLGSATSPTPASTACAPPTSRSGDCMATRR